MSNEAEASAVAAGPTAARRDHALETHGDVRNDPYYWLRDDQRENTEVLAYLNAENDYTNTELAHLEGLKGQLFEEMSARLAPNDSSVPYRTDVGWFARRYEAGKEMPIHVWWPGQAGEWPEGEAQVLLDENALGAKLDFYEVGNYDVSPDGQWLAWAEDTLSRGIYQLRFRSLAGDGGADEVIEGVASSLAFANDGKTIFYMKLQDETLIPWQVWRHELGTDPSNDVLVYQEDDSTFFNSLGRSADGQWIVIAQSSTTMTEYSVISTNQPHSDRQVVIPRQRDHEYQVELLGDQAYVLTNEGAVDFRLITVPLAQAADRSQWQELLAQRPNTLLQDLQVLRDYVIVEEISNANQRLRVLPLKGGDSFHISADEPAYLAYLGANEQTNTDTLRYVYSSPTTPATTFDLNLKTGEKVQRKQEFAGSDFDASKYETTRLEITARDGTLVPVTLLHRRGQKTDGQAPLYLQGYGSYGFSYLPGFNSQVLSLVDRGFVTGVAHIRGGQEKGRQWYDNGKLLNKKNTFTDFIDVAQGLVKQGWAHPEKVAGSGRSAGGLLIGAVANMAPETFKVLLAGVPFVDVVTTMLDESIPLTTYEYDEWGNPNQKAFYDYMLSYSPYDNLHQGPYPNILVTTGLWDPAVQYWEPAKWVASLRATKQDNNALLLYTDMTAGHRGGAGRFDRLKDRSMEYAFMMDHLGMVKK
ncbi:MAG: S9 family peptidase [Xanthomonadales bacterium]|nr:S9 family peptidase [Xanthomonadales bacterium]